VLHPNDFVCGGHDDIAAALTGMRPDQVWIARLEMNLPREALSMDCNVGLAASQSFVSNQLQAPKATNVPCAGGAIQASATLSLTNQAAACVWAIGSFVSLVARRRRRKASRDELR
jgi:hypothetical protein